ncbi:EAL domain-containing protein [Acinetobacter sp. RF15A]|uniref:EAL domain-containing protein n=1 Tax=unclassified Acinetobacter TaxID=196816 RepID=UPI00118ED078|nr:MULTISPECIES: EAL domain-containing protein [unclassified Acinetobacter]TSH78485.1 EAL domain-containing protein [Acinetobacter sp. RF15A]TSI20813.1 EAL domain-containing protein [Acinetobacter sp. RF15B]
MGSIKVRNPLLSKKLKRTETRLLIIDDNQIRYNQIRDLLSNNQYQVDAVLLDDLQSFEKQLNFNWDLIIFGRAYDLKYEQALSLVRLSHQPELPIILLKPEDYKAEQYAQYVHKGIYDILNLDYPERFYIGLVRALSFSRGLQTQQHLMNELETAQNQAQSLVEDSNRAVATIQEGIHIQANADYLKLFGLQNEDDLIGLPLLDLLQPEDLNEFKTRFKKISQGQFDLGRFDIVSVNPKISAANPLKLEFLASTTEEDALQITIDTQAQSQSGTDKALGKPGAFQLLKRKMSKQPAPFNALVTFSLTYYDPAVLSSDWHTFSSYFNEIRAFLKEQTHAPLFKLEYDVFVGLFQADSKQILESKLIGLNALSKPQLITVGQNSFPLNFRIGYIMLEDGLNDESHYNELVAQAFSTALPQAEAAPEFILDTSAPATPQALQMPGIDFSVAKEAPLSPTTAVISPAVTSVLDGTPSILKALRVCLDRGEIHLKYQQLYDKEDTRLYRYEVTSGFIFDNKWQDISSILELREDDELSIKLDRWILVEASKQLHNFITQYPDASLIVNLNRAVLFKDRTFPEFISKLITIIRSKNQHPLTLQFSEEDVLLNQQDAQKYLRVLHEHGALTSLRDFGQSIYSPNLLQELELDGVSLHSSLTQMLNHDTEIEELQEKIASYNEIRPLNILIRELNDMTLFANAWNVDARFIQGDYFQKKLDHLIDVQDH